MAFELRGHPILSLGEFVELMHAMRRGAEAPPAIVAWFGGERLSPRTLQLALDKCAVYVEDDRGHELLSLAARRMNLALGRDEISFEEMPAAEPGEL
jgi:hypothetical protein